MSVEKVSRLRSKVEELRSVRKKIVDEIRERQHKLEEIDGVRDANLIFKIKMLEEAQRP